MKRLEIETELVIDMYVNQGMSVKKIGKIFNTSPTTIKRRLKGKNITIKSPAQACREITEKQVDIEKIVDMYVNQKIRLTEVGKKLNVSYGTVRRKLKQLGIKRRKSGPNPTELDIVKLEDMYVNQKMSTIKIGEIMEVNPKTIWRKLEILGIPCRSKSENAILINTQKKKDYSRKNMSPRNIVGRGSSCIEHQQFSGGPNLGKQTPIRKRLGGNSPNPTTI